MGFFFLLFILSILCGPHHWALLSAWLPQMALNNVKTTVDFGVWYSKDTNDVLAEYFDTDWVKLFLYG